MGSCKGCILCIENQHEICEQLAPVFNNLGFCVVKASSCYEGLNKSSLVRFNLYLINSGLPDGSSAELCQQIRTGDPQTPIIFTSGGNDIKEFSDANEADANYILSKPFKLDKLA